MAEFLVYLFLFSFINLIGFYECRDTNDLEPLGAKGDVEPLRTESDYVYWPFASVPFYIDPEHFDHEQSLAIMTTLSLFSYKTCLKFAPVLTMPEISKHVLLFENPTGVRQCQFNTRGHSIDEPHRLVVGYDCIKTPYLEMMVMRVLGFPFEHNRAIRNIYIDVQPENVEPAYIELFTKEGHLPMQLRSLPYDVNSVMHFGEREFSKNGHRTIIFKDHKVRQTRNGLSPIDIKKIQIVYGPECIARDRQEKIELCQNFPGAARKKREIDTPDPTKSLRVNRNITPPRNLIVEDPQPHNNSYDVVSKSLTELGIENEVQLIIDQVNKVSALALQHAREKYCNKTKSALRVGDEIKKKAIDILGIVESVAQYAQSMVDHALSNLTEFCEQSQSLELYQRQKFQCPFFNSVNCPQTYKSTKSGPVKYSTQHRPLIRQSTKHEGTNLKRGQYDSMYKRARDDNASIPENATETNARKKREIKRLRNEDFVIYPVESSLNVRRKRDISDADSPMSEPVTTASSNYQTTTENNGRKKRELDIDVGTGHINVRSKRDIADNTSETENTPQSSTIESTTINIEAVNFTEANVRKKRELDIDTRDFNVKPLIHNKYFRSKREIADNTSETTSQSSTSESTTGNTETVNIAEARKKRELDIETRDTNDQPQIHDVNLRRKRDVVDNTSETETTQSSTTVEVVNATEARKKRELVNVQPLIHNMNVRNKRDVPVNTSVTEITQNNITESTRGNTEAANVNESVKVEKAVDDHKEDTEEDTPKLGEMEVVVVSTDKTGGYVDAEYVSKSALRMGTTIVRDGNKWAPQDRRSEPVLRRMFRAKYPVDARRRGNFETMHWEPDGSEGEQRDLEEAKRVIREDPDLKFILEGNQAKLFEPNKKEAEDSEAELPRKKIVEKQDIEIPKKKIIEDSEEELPKKKMIIEDSEEELPNKKILQSSDEEVSQKKIQLDSEEDAPKKKRERGKKRQKEINDYEERKKKKIEEDYEERKRNPVVEDYEERKIKKGTKIRDQRAKKAQIKVSSSESNEVPEPKIKEKIPIKVKEEVVSTDEEDVLKLKKIKKLIKPFAEQAEEESEVEAVSVKKDTKKIVSSYLNMKEDSEPVRRPAKKNIVESPIEKDDSVEIEVTSRRPIPRTVDLTRKNKDFYEDRKWPDGLVPYIIQDDPKYDIEDVRRRIKEVNDILKEKTCVQLKEILPTETNKYEDYLVLDTSPDYVTGRVGGKQNFGVVELFQGGQHRQHAAMMAMAMLGFYFEVSRHDRDQFIRVHTRHVRPDKLHHFEKIRSDATLHLPYDYKSATHPAWQFWRHLGRTGISTVATYKEKDPDGSIMKLLGQNQQLLSDLDLVKINSIYGVKCFKQPRKEDTLRRKVKH